MLVDVHDQLANSPPGNTKPSVRSPNVTARSSVEKPTSRRQRKSKIAKRMSVPAMRPGKSVDKPPAIPARHPANSFFIICGEILIVSPAISRKQW